MRLWPLILLSLLTLAARAADYSGQPGPYRVLTLEQTWTDASRGREVPVKLYYPATPADAAERFPVIVFSHGLGGTRDGYRYLGEHWASCGYVVVHVQHHGSDREALRGWRLRENFKKIVSDPQAAIDRPRDISFAIDRLTALDGDARFVLHGRLDLARLGVGGHSFGAFTTMAVAGAHIPVLGPGPHARDPRVKAAIAMSTPSNRDSDTDAAFDDVRIPVFHLTGTKDESPGGRSQNEEGAIVGETTAAQRLLPYRHTRHAPALLLVFQGGDHMVFSGRLTASRPTDQAFQERMLAGSTAFWDAWLKGDAAAKAWLENGSFAAQVGNLGDFQHKEAK